MTRHPRWTAWLRALVGGDRTPEQILGARLDEIDKQLREHHSTTSSKS